MSTEMESRPFPEQAPAKEQKNKIITNPEQAREAMRQFWHRETDIDTIKREVEDRREGEILQLLSEGHEMTVLRLRQDERKEEGPRPEISHNHFIFASQNEIKRGIVAESAEKEGMSLEEVPLRSEKQDEQQAHQLIKQMIQEEEEKRRRPHQPHSAPRRVYDPIFYAIDIAEEKASKAWQANRNQIILASDTVVLAGKNILEKPKDKQEALEMLKLISGKKVRISSGVVLLAPTGSGKTIALKEGGYFTIKLRDFSIEEAERYLSRTKEGYLNTAGVIDYGDPLAQNLISDTPVKAEPLEFGRKFGEAPKKAFLSAGLLPELKDYFLGVPNELIEEILKEGKLISGSKN